MSKTYATQQPQGYHNYIKTVAVVGATGQIGTYLVRHLLATGQHQVIAITRAESGGTLPDRVEKRVVDYEKPDTLVTALRGVDCLLITMSVKAPAEQQSMIIKAAADAKVPWILPNEWGIDHSDREVAKATMVGQKLDKYVKEIQELGVSKYILFNCGFWYEYSLGSGCGTYGFNFKERRLTLIDEGTIPLNTSTFDQVGLGCAKLLSLKILPDDENDKSVTLSQYANKFFYMASFRLSQLDMFASVKRVTGTTDADWSITKESSTTRYSDALKKLQGGDYLSFARVMYTRLFYPDAAGDFESRFSLQNQAIGLPKADLDEATKRGIEHAMTTKLSFP